MIREGTGVIFAPSNPTEQIHSAAPPRVHHENANPNNKVMREASVHVQQEHFLKNLRPKQAFYYDRVPNEKIEQYHAVRQQDITRDQTMIHNRFPELKEAREAFLGPDAQNQRVKQSHAQELVQFSDVVQKLAKEEEPYAQNLWNQDAQESTKKGKKNERPASLGLYARGTKKNPENVLLGNQTMAAALKNKYIVRSRHSVLGGDRFAPVNPHESKMTVQNHCRHIDGDLVSEQDPHSRMQKIKDVSMQQRTAHGASLFLGTSPISQNQERAWPGITLDKDSTFAKYVPPVKAEKNPRLMALDNFKEISRIMTKNFLEHKKLEKRFEKTVIPKAERERKRHEDEAQQRMVDMLKKMHSPTTFMSPNAFQETSVDNFHSSQIQKHNEMTGSIAKSSVF